MRQQRTAQRAGLGGVIFRMEILWLGSVSNPLIPTMAIISNESNEASGGRDNGIISVMFIIGSNASVEHALGFRHEMSPPSRCVITAPEMYKCRGIFGV